MLRGLTPRIEEGYQGIKARIFGGNTGTDSDYATPLEKEQHTVNRKLLKHLDNLDKPEFKKRKALLDEKGESSGGWGEKILSH